MEFERALDPENIPTSEDMISGSSEIPCTEMIDMFIEVARDKKKTIDSKMDSLINLMREVEHMEKAAEQAKQQSDECSLDVVGQVDDVKQAAQRAKEKNDMHAKEVYAQKAALATEMDKVQLRVLGVSNEGNKFLSDLDEISRSLEKRLNSAMMKKEAADKQKLENEALFANHINQMEMTVEEAKRLEQEAMQNSELQEFLRDRGHVVDMLREEIYCKRLDMDLLKKELEDYQVEKELKVTEQYLTPIMQEPPWLNQMGVIHV
uniref:uncharacterized protein LOC122609444 n=1 Tax=Erigeron canadensis TaxID=72917 RepID=UPI001CB8E1ED|nr:uncharacterized protein LOC122609444 [Erigeron canadensis]